MKNKTLLKYITSLLFLSTIFTSSLFSATQKECTFYNTQYDKYSQLVDQTPDVAIKKQQYIDKMDFYDTKIFEDNTCNLQKIQKKPVHDDLFESLFK